ncbi:MAG: hypothetical protein NTW21_19380 [Verrucomicrobia bacterium]|nr:hypothetical protein [Verrucomicrobiota bacterium]
MKTTRLITLACGTLAAFLQPASAAPVALDLSFGGTGKVTTNFGGSYDQAYSVALQSDGKIVVAGYSSNDFAVVRYNPNGSLDTTFNVSGKVLTDFGGDPNWGRSVAVQGDGKILLAGTISGGSAMARYNTNGTLDTSFNGTGKVITTISNGVCALQRDGKIVLAGTTPNDSPGNSYDFAMVRYRADGSLDTTFSPTGYVTTDFTGGSDSVAGVVMQNDGRIVVAGSSHKAAVGSFAVARYGSPDTDGDGILDEYETGTGVYVSPENTGTSPTNPDTDGDGLNDGQEVYAHHSNPHLRDTDGDGFEDDFEVQTGFSPILATSVPDAASSIRLAVEYRFNAGSGLTYRIESSTNLTDWTTVETNIIGTGGVINRFYSIEGQPQQFFRSRRN